MAALGNWEGAFGQWLTVAVDSGKAQRHRGKAMFNLAVANEMLGQPAEALGWAQRSHYECEHYEAGEYILLLRERLMDKVRLQRQMTVTDSELINVSE